MIKAPNWKKDAVPSIRGWHDPRTNELLQAQKISQAELDEWFGKPVPVVESYTVEVEEPKPTYASMTKTKLEEWARLFGVELDRRKTKEHMIEDFEEATKTKSDVPPID